MAAERLADELLGRRDEGRQDHVVRQDPLAVDLDAVDAPPLGQQPGHPGPRPHPSAVARDGRRDRRGHHVGHAAEERSDAQGVDALEVGAEGAEEGVRRVALRGEEVEPGGERDQHVVDGVLGDPVRPRLVADADPVERGGVGEVLRQAGGEEAGQGEAVEEGEQAEVPQRSSQGLEGVVQGGGAEHAVAPAVGQPDLDLVLPVDDLVDVDARPAQEVGEGLVEAEDAVEPGLDLHPDLVPGGGAAADHRARFQQQYLIAA